VSDYRAPLKEMQFLVEQAVAATGVHSIEELAEFDMETVAAVLEAAGEFAHRGLAPLNPIGDAQGCGFADGKVTTPEGWKAAYDQFCQDGWMGLALPTDFGGQQLPKFIAQPVNEMWHSANLSFVMFHALNQGCSEILLRLGTQEQQDRYIAKLISGEWTAAMALTEPAAGSDLGELKTKATPLADGRYLIKGQKIYISYGEHDLSENKIHFVLARTPNAPEGSRGISLFAVPTYRIDGDGSLGEFNDVLCTGIEHKTGLHGSPTCSISYGDNEACYGELIGSENRGLAAMFILMNEARLAVGLQGVALGELAYQKASEYARERTQGAHYQTNARRVPIIQHPDVSRLLLSIKSQVFGQRALGYLIAALVDKSEHCREASERDELEARIALLTPIFKAFATEQCNWMAGAAIQVFGGMGFVEETGVAQIMRDARITTIYEGTTGIQAKDLLFRKMLADSGSALESLLSDIDQTAAKLKATEGMTSLGGNLSGATYALRAIVKQAITSQNLLQLNAGAVAMLEALGFLTSAWQLGESALRAQTELEQQRDAKFHRNIIALAKFHDAHCLPQLHARLSTFSQAAAGIAEYSFDE